MFFKHLFYIDRKTGPAYSSKSDQNEPETVSGQMTKGVATYVSLFRMINQSISFIE